MGDSYLRPRVLHMGAVASTQGVLELAESRVGRVLRGKYTIESVIGVGGMAVVYKARHRNQKQFAIKMLHPEYMMRADVHARFVREGYVANSVGHPGVVAVLDDDVDDAGYPYLVMELLEGATVESLCPPGGPPVPVREALTIVYQLLDVLVAAHERGIVHRDLKPANLFVSQCGKLKVLDFGVARLRDATLDAHATHTGGLLGTPGFMAPEQALGELCDVDARTDLWSVGATLFTMLSGKIVHEGENSRQVAVRAATEPARSLAAVAPEVPPSVVRAVSKALMFRPADRWQSAACMRDYVHGVHLRLYGDISFERVATLVAVSEKRLDSLPTEPSPVRTLLPPASQEMTIPSPIPLVEADSTTPVTTAHAVSSRTPRESASTYRSLNVLGLALCALFLFAMYDAVSGIGAGSEGAAYAASGEVRVRVNTLLGVPNELDWLSWKVIRAGQSHPSRAGSLDLERTSQLPVSFTALSTRDTEGSILIEVVAKHGGEHGIVRARKQVTVSVAERRTRTLELTLERP